MSCVAEANAVRMNKSYVNVNRPDGVRPEAIISGEGCGMLRTSSMKAAVINACIVTIHHLFDLKISTRGLQSGFNVQGR